MGPSCVIIPREKIWGYFKSNFRVQPNCENIVPNNRKSGKTIAQKRDLFVEKKLKGNDKISQVMKTSKKG